MTPSPRAYAYGHFLNALLLFSQFNFFVSLFDVRFLLIGSISTIVWLILGYLAPEKPIPDRL